MSDHVPMASASDRYAAARKALADYDTIDGWNGTHAVMIANADALASALRALIVTEHNHDTEQQIADRIADEYLLDTDCYCDKAVPPALLAAVRAGEQSAYERYEPEVALRPTQEQMLRWLGIEYETPVEGTLYLPEQAIEEEL